MTATAIFRVFGPAFGGTAFAWSISGQHVFPFNHYFAFISFSFVFLGAYYMCRRLPTTLNSPIKEE